MTLSPLVDRTRIEYTATLAPLALPDRPVLTVTANKECCAREKLDFLWTWLNERGEAPAKPFRVQIFRTAYQWRSGNTEAGQRLLLSTEDVE